MKKERKKERKRSDKIKKCIRKRILNEENREGRQKMIK